MLFDPTGQAIYLFDKEEGPRAECYGACAEAWPPFYAKGRPRAGRGVDRCRDDQKENAQEDRAESHRASVQLDAGSGSDGCHSAATMRVPATPRTASSADAIEVITACLPLAST